MSVSSSSTWGDVPGQPAAIAALRSALAGDELAHAWLMVGPRDVGQVELARALGAALNCPAPPAADTGCGECSACQRILRGVHPAVQDLEPEGANHVVDVVRSGWIRAATRTMAEGRRRVLRVVAADRMNEAAQNAFLKILEEPPPSVVWLLDAAEEGALLDTVVSRCRRLVLVPLAPEVMHRRAAALDIPEAEREALVRASLGLPERLRDLADPDVAAARKRHLGVLDRLATGGPGQVVPVARELAAWGRSRATVVKERHAGELAALEESYGVEGGRGWPPGVRQRLSRRFERVERQEQRRALHLVLDDLSSYLRDLLAVQAGAEDQRLVNLDHAAALRRDATRLPPPDAVRSLAAVADCREALEGNGAPELQLERLLLAIALPIYAASAA